jgi:hypothetical protein
LRSFSDLEGFDFFKEGTEETFEVLETSKVVSSFEVFFGPRRI